MSDHPDEAASARRLILEMGGVAVAYLVLGRLGLLLAIPPGYATAIFPPAGLALHRVLRRGPLGAPGVFLGSYLLNLSISWSGPLGHGWKIHAIAGMLALASTLQALLGAWLVRRVSPEPMRLDRPRDLMAVLGAGGLLGCLTAATLATGALWAMGLLPTQAVPYAWWTWWVGDALGVVLFVPALEMITSRERLWRDRRLTVGLPLALGLATVVVIFVRVSRSEEEALHRNLRLRAEQARGELVANLQGRSELLQAMSGLVKVVPDLRPVTFRTFVDPYLLRYPDVHSVDWVPRISGAQRKAFERRMSAALGEPFEVRDMTAAPTPQPAGIRDEYWPVTLKHPLPPNRLALGLDLKERPFQGPLMIRSRDEGITQLVVLERLAQDPVPRPAMVLTMPVFPEDRVPPTAERASALLGFVSVLFYADPILAEAADRAHALDVNLSLTALRSDGKPMLAARTSPEAAQDTWVEQVPLELYGASLTLEARPTAAFFLTRKGWQVFLVLAGGLGFTGMMGALLLLISGEVSEAKGLAEDRGRALATVEARARVILDHAVEPILTLDPSGHVESANRAAQNLLGWDLPGLLGRPITELVPGLMSHLKSTGGSGSIREAMAFPREGEPIPLEVGLNAVEVEGRVIFTAFLRDLRDRRRLERIKNELIAVVSHELRTPLTSIRGTLGLLEGGVSGQLPEKAQDLVRIAHQNARHLGAIVDDILDLEKLEHGQLRLDFKVQALAPLLEKSVELNQGFASRLGVTLELGGAALPGAQARVDGGRLVQVLGNLISNAVKHSPQGSTVTLSLLAADQAWRLEVRDHGPGVPQGFEDLLFEKFTQADTSEVRRIPGTGLGLSISRALIEGMGGAIGYRNERDGGATFYVELPRA
ncbi:MAG TPA: CHASE domain-containing protein [Holophagaceae bacterium]|nr:CHASE domain-containing protein [Holophagaceae bacterium]